MLTLVTGATGQVGRGFVPRLLAQARPGERVRVIVRDEARAAALAERGAEVVVGDLRDTDVLGKALTGADAVVNIAASFRGVTDEEMRAVNRDAALELGRAALASGVRRFVQTSTILVYGAGRGRPHVEDDPTVPGGPMWMTYPESKREAEQGLLALDGLDVRIGRLGFVYGEGDPHLPGITRWTATQPATKRHHLVHVADTAQGLLRLLHAPGADGRVYNIADDAPVTALEIHQLLGEEPPADGPDPDPWYGIASTDRIRRELGYRPYFPTLWAARDAGAL
ncbi:MULTISPECIES: NAD-dependent epimerase/dehydratase family protein [Streptomyces]|uniref:NAD(P)-dependent oxidoreductase n=1 Tax=Streptomyces flaveolus TaxID=67297 RepID=A0ABV3A8P7_9ACTN|nr:MULTISPECIES: NAD(P)-dependent oxidoreductase [Streptomyces]KOV75660.1 epimerase [Streptomyces sp. NRRL WC-3723]MBG7698380.1 NAD(P)-dependent oxidoreductase [Streptomyces sp. MC1]